MIPSGVKQLGHFPSQLKGNGSINPGGTYIGMNMVPTNTGIVFEVGCAPELSVLEHVERCCRLLFEFEDAFFGSVRFLGQG